MSEINGFFLTQLVIRNSSLSGSAYTVAIIIADRYDQRKGYSSASSRTVAQLAGLTPKTVLAALTEIEESGEWIVEKAKGATTRYYPVISKVSARQEKRKKDVGSRGSGLSKGVTPEQGLELLPEQNQSKSKKASPEVQEVPAVEVPVQYPETSEDTDPYLNGLPLLPSDTGSLIEIVRPPVLTTPLAMAVRLHKRTDIKSRVNKKEFTVEHITSVIEELSQSGAPLEVIDILLWLQCENRKPLSVKFMRLVLTKCVNNGQVIKPVKWYEDKEDPAYNVACDVVEIYHARHSLVTSEYAEFL